MFFYGLRFGMGGVGGGVGGWGLRFGVVVLGFGVLGLNGFKWLWARWVGCLSWRSCVNDGEGDSVDEHGTMQLMWSLRQQ